MLYTQAGMEWKQKYEELKSNQGALSETMTGLDVKITELQTKLEEMNTATPDDEESKETTTTTPKTPTLSSNDPLCTKDPTTGGYISFPVADTYKNIPYLGEVFTAYSCGPERLARLGAGNGKFERHSRITLAAAPNAELLNMLKRVGYTCADKGNQIACLHWELTKPVSLEAVAKLEPYSAQFLQEECLDCKQ